MPPGFSDLGLVFHVTLTADALGVAPAGDETLGTNICTSPWQRDSGDSRVEGGGRAQFNQHDVIIDGPGIVFGVADDLGRIDELLVALNKFDVVLSQTHLDSAGREE